MTAQVIATPPGCYHTVESGGSIVVPLDAEIIFQISEIDDEGNVGPIIDPVLLETEVSDVDLIVTLPNGTVIVFPDLVPLLGPSSGIADASGTPIINSLESVINPAAGPTGGDGESQGAGGSLLPASPFFDDGFGNVFGLSPSGAFFPFGPPGLVIPAFDPNLPILLGDAGPIPQLASFGLPPGDMTMGLEDKPIPLLSTVTQNDIEGLGEILSVEIRDIPPGATILDADGNVLFVSVPGATSFNTTPVQLPTLQITPPLADDDSDFTVTLVATTFEPTNPAAGTATATVMLPIVVKAVADLAKFTLDNQIAGEHPMSVIKNPIQIEMEGRGGTGANDPDLTAPDFGAQDLGTLIAPTAENPQPVVTVDGWINVNDPNDVDLYKVEIAQDGTYKFDIDFGDTDAAGNENGRIDDADVQITVYDATGTFAGNDDVSGPGLDPETFLTLTAGTYFVAVSQSFNDPLGGLADGFSGTGLNVAGGPGDYELSIQLDGPDVMPGDMFTQMVIEDNAQIITRVALFKDPAYVDVAVGVPPTQNDEADEIQTSIEAFGHEVRTFTGTTAMTWADNLTGVDVLVIPELEVASGDLPADLLASGAVAEILNFVNNGGKLIINGDSSLGSGATPGEVATLLNAVFPGFALTETRLPNLPSQKTADAGTTAFSGAPESLAGNSAMTGLTGLPPGSTSLYEVGGFSTVAQIPVGASGGQILFLGWDWFGAFPTPGIGDGGWMEVLGIALGQGGAMLPPADQMHVDPTDAAFRAQHADIDLMVSDTDGSESITRVRITVDDLPPGYMLDVNGDNFFLTPGSNPFRDIAVTRIPPGGGPANIVTGTIEVDIGFNAATGEAVFEIDPLLRVQSIDLSSFSWKVDQHNDQDFMIKFEVRTTETNPTETNDTLDETQVATPHAYQTATLMVNNKAVADKPTLTIGSMVDCEDNAELDPTNNMYVDRVPVFAIQATAAVTDTDLSESLTEVKIDWSTLPAVADQLSIGTPPVVVNPGPLMLDVMTDMGAETVTAQVAITGQMASLTFLAADRVQSVDLNQLGLRLPQHKDGKFAVLIEATATETNPSEAGDVAVPSQTQTATFTLDVQAVADKASVVAANQSPREDNATLVSSMHVDGDSTYATPITATLQDQDGSETITTIVLATDFLSQGLTAGDVGVVLDGAPLGTLDTLPASSMVTVNVTLVGAASPSTTMATLTVSGDDLTLTFAESPPIQQVDLSGLAFDLPQHKDGVFNIDWTVTTKEVAPMGDIKAGADTAVISGRQTLSVGAVADKPTVAFPDATPGTPNPVISVVEDNAMAMPDHGPLEARDILQQEAELLGNDTFAMAQDLGTITGNAATSLTVAGSLSFVDIDFYEFTVTQAGTFYLDIDGAAFTLDTQLSLFNSAGQLIAFDDDSPADPGSASNVNLNTLDSFIGGIFLEADTYKVAVTPNATSPSSLPFPLPANGLSLGGHSFEELPPDTTFLDAGGSEGDYQLQIRTTLDDKPPLIRTFGDVSLQDDAFDGPGDLPTTTSSDLFAVLTTETGANSLSGLDALTIANLEAAIGIDLTTSTTLSGSAMEFDFFTDAIDSILFNINVFANSGSATRATVVVLLDGSPFLTTSLIPGPSDGTVYDQESGPSQFGAPVPTAGLHTLTVVVIDEDGDSAIGLDNFRLQSGNPLFPEMTFDKSNVHTLGITVDAVDTDGSEGLTFVTVIAPPELDITDADWFLGDTQLVITGSQTLTGTTVGGATTVQASVGIAADGQTITLSFPDPAATPDDQVLSVDLSELAIRTPRHLHGSFDIQVLATSKEQNPMGPAAVEAQQQSATVTLEIAAVADKPLFSNVVETVTGTTAIPLDFKITTPDDDGSECLSAITVSGLPAGSSLSFTTNAGVQTETDDDGDGSITIDLTTVTGPSPGGTFTPNGKLVMLDTSAGGFNLTYTPPTGATGSFLVTVTATSTEMDGVSAPIEVLSQSDSTDILVQLNQPPDVDLDFSNTADNDFATVFLEDGSTTPTTSIPGSDPVAIGDIFPLTDILVTDPDADPIQTVVVTLTNPQDGPSGSDESLSLEPGLPLTIIPPVPAFGHSLTFTSLGGLATETDFETALSLVRYDNVSDTPNTTVRRVEVVATDDQGNSSAPATAFISVNPANDAPDAINDLFTATDEDTLVAAPAGGIAFGSVFDDNGMGADSDPEMDDFDVSFLFNIMLMNAPAGMTPSAVSDNGTTFSFDLTVAGNVATVTVVKETGAVSMEATTGDPFSALAQGATANIKFDYTVSDGNGGMDTVAAQIDVTGVNDPPAALDDSFTTDEDVIEAGANFVGNVALDLTTGDIDPEGDTPLTVTSITTGGGGPLSGLTISPSLGVTGISFDASPGLGSAYEATLTTSAGNDAILIVDEDGDIFLDADAGDDPFGFLGVGESGTIAFQYTVADPMGASASAMATITVNGANEPPNAVDDLFTATDEDTLANAPAGGIAFGSVFDANPTTADSDPEMDDLDVSAISNIVLMNAPAGMTGAVTVSPNPANLTFELTVGSSVATVTVVKETGAVSMEATSGDPFGALAVGDTANIKFDYTVSDGNGGTDTATAQIDVEGRFDVIFVDNNDANWGSPAGSGGSGTQDDPFQSIEAFNDATTGPGAIIYLRSGLPTGYTEAEGFDLQDGQILIGQGLSLGLELAKAEILGVPGLFVGEELAGTAPVINATGTTADDNGIDLASNNVVRGLDIGTTSAGNSGIFGMNVGDLDIEDVAITNTSGQAIDIDGGGTLDVTFDSITSTSSSGEGIDINNVGGSFSVTGNTAVTNSGGTGVDISGSTGTFSFGGLDIDNSTSNQKGLDASSGGTIDVTGSGNVVNTGSATAVDIDGTMIGTNGVTFESVSSSGGTATGIILNSAGSGGFTVTGNTTTTTAGSGGTIADKTGTNGQAAQGTGVFIQNTDNVSLSQMQLDDFANFGIRGNNVDGFQLIDSVINGTNGNSNPLDEGSVSFDELTGTVNIHGSDISGGFENNIVIINTSGTLNLDMDDTTSNQMIVGLNGTTNGGDSMLIEAQGGATVNVVVENTNFTGARQDLFHAKTSGNQPTLDVTLRDNIFNNTHSNTNTGAEGGGRVFIEGDGTNIDIDYLIEGMNAGDQTFNGAVGSAILVRTTTASSGTVTGTIQNNAIGTAGVPGSGSVEVSGITAGSQGTTQHDVTIHANTIRSVGTGLVGNAGIEVFNNTETPGGVTTMTAVITNNDVAQLGGFAFTGLWAAVGAGSNSQNGVMNLDVRDNVFDATGPTFSSNAVFLTDNGLARLNLPPAYTGSGQGENAVPAGTASADISLFYVGQGNTLTNGLFPNFAGGGVDATDVENLTNNAFLHAAAPAGEDAAVGVEASLEDVAALTEAAIERWLESGISEEQLAVLEGATISVADLSGSVLAVNMGDAIVVDIDAAGYGWFVDTTPFDDAEFETVTSDTSLLDGDGPAAGAMDLLTVLMHELGHSLGLPDLYDAGSADELMAATLEAGTRKLPEPLPAGEDATLARSDLLEDAAADPLRGLGDAGSAVGDTALNPQPVSLPETVVLEEPSDTVIVA